MTDVVNTQGTTSGAAPEGHEEAMLAKVDAKEAELAKVGTDAPKQEEGEKILGKFSSTEDLAKAYQELERKLSQGNKQEDAPKDPPVDMTEDKASELIVKAGLDVNAMAAEFNETGELSEDSYKSLETAGIPRAYVDQYVSGVRAEAEQMRDSIFQEVGGEEAFQTMISWAVAHMKPQEIADYNAAVDSGDMAVVRSAVMGMAYKYQRSVGTEPNLLRGDGGKASNGFESLAQLTEAMKDPRYEKDPAFRRDVEQRLASSSIF